MFADLFMTISKLNLRENLATDYKIKMIKKSAIIRINPCHPHSVSLQTAS